MICRWCRGELIYGCGSVMHAEQILDAMRFGNIALAVLCKDTLHQALAEDDIGVL